MTTCQYQIRRPRFSGEPPEPPEYCEREIEDCDILCAAHCALFHLYPHENED